MESPRGENCGADDIAPENDGEAKGINGKRRCHVLEMIHDVPLKIGTLAAPLSAFCFCAREQRRLAGCDVAFVFFDQMDFDDVGILVRHHREAETAWYKAK